MKVAALGDAHLGRSYYPFVASPGVNQREKDFEDAFEAAVDTALAQSPDLIVWLGDIFDQPRPSFRTYQKAQAQLTKIRQHAIPMVIISGNHDTPRLPGRGSPYSPLADMFAEFNFAHSLEYRYFDIAELRVHAVPQMLTVPDALAALDEANDNRSLDRTNLLLTHPRLTQLQPKQSDINELEIDMEQIRSDLVLLGHYHTYSEVKKGKMWYAGSTDTFSFADEPDVAKGIVVLDTDSAKCEHIEVASARRLVTLSNIWGQDLSATELSEQILKQVSSAPEGSIARLYIEEVDPDAYRLVDFQEIFDSSPALHVKLEPQFATRTLDVELPEIHHLSGQWEKYIEGQELLSFDRTKIRDLGRDYIESAIEGSE